MGLKNILEEFNNTKEPMLSTIIEFFENNPGPISISTIQREFGFGYRRATRAKKQLKESFNL